LLKKDGILMNLKKERQMLMLFSSRILLCWRTNVVGNLYTQKDLRFFWKTLFLERLFLFFCFFLFWSWLKDRISLSERLVFFPFWKTSNWFRKTCYFLFWKTFFIRKTGMLKKDMNFIFRKTCCCNFLQKDL